MRRLPERQGGRSHAGGYLPFSLDITEYAGDDNELLVRVQDFSDSSYFSRGKQKLEKRRHVLYRPKRNLADRMAGAGA